MKVFLSFFALVLGLISLALPTSLTPGIGASKPKPRRRWHIDGNAAMPSAMLKRLVDRVLRYRRASKARYYVAAGHAQAA